MTKKHTKHRSDTRNRNVLHRRTFLAGAAAAAGTMVCPAFLRGGEEGGKRYRVGAIGHTGRGDYGHGLDKVWLDVPAAEIVAVADADPKGLADAAKRIKAPKQYADYRRMLEEAKPELLSICPRFLDEHCEMVLAAAEAGVRGIYMEKPVCRTLEEADRMVAACEKHKVKVALAHQTRYSPKLKVVRELIGSGKLGKLLEIRARGKEDTRGGAEDLFVLGPHLLDVMQHLAGKPQWCFGTVLQKGRPITKADIQPGPEGIGLLAGDEVHAMYRLAGGAVGYFDSVKDTGGGPRFGVWIFGSKGVIEMGTNYMPWSWFLPHTSWSAPRYKKPWLEITSAGLGKPEPLKNATPHDGDIVAVKDLIAAVEEDRKPAADITEARTALEMVAAVFESQRLAKPAPIPLACRTDPLAAF
jgi:predicted dehydrogenase